MQRLYVFAATLATAALVAAALSGAVARAATCTTVTTSKGVYTAAVVDPGSFTGPLDASGCQIGIYFDTAGSVSAADISGATYYGVFADEGAAVDVSGSTIHQIGDTPFSGAQHGLGIYYTAGATGTVDGNTVSAYQKNGITVTGDGTDVDVTDNAVTGQGQVPSIAQNGIEFGFGASGSARGNTIDGNWYTGADWTATGLLLFDVDASEVKTSNNKYVDNQTNHAMVEAHACAKMYGGVYADYGLC